MIQSRKEENYRNEFINYLVSFSNNLVIEHILKHILINY